MHSILFLDAKCPWVPLYDRLYRIVSYCSDADPEESHELQDLASGLDC